MKLLLLATPVVILVTLSGVAAQEDRSDLTAEVFALVNQLACSGNAVLLFSSEMEELLGVSDRILMMNKGRLVATLPRAEATQELIMHYAASDDV